MLSVSKDDNTIAAFDGALPTAAAIAASQRTIASGFENQPGRFAIQGIDAGRDGNIYAVNRGASNTGSCAIERVTPLGVVTRFASGLGNVWGVSFGPDGNLYFPDANSSSANASSISRIAPNGTATGFAAGLPLNGPYGLTFAPGNLLIVSSVTDGTIIQVDSAGTAGKYHEPSGAYTLSNPKGLAWGPGGFYAANFGNSTVPVITPLDATVFASSSPTRTWPTDGAFDELGNLFVSNVCHDTISKYDTNGNLLLSFSTGTYAPLWLAFDQRAVPEIDPAPAGSVLALCAGALALLERRRRPGTA